MTILTSLVGLAAGVLSTLSPCVLPLLPLVVGTAVSQHRFGPAALAAGLALSFVTIGLFVATIGFSIGLDASVFRSVAAVLMLGAGAVLLVPQFQTRLSTAAGPVGAWAEERFGGLTPTGLRGQFGVGLLLGAVWESLCWPSTGRDIDPCRARQVSRRGRHRDGGLRRGAEGRHCFCWDLCLERRCFGGAPRCWKRVAAEKPFLALFCSRTDFSFFPTSTGILETFLVEISPPWLTHLTTQI